MSSQSKKNKWSPATMQYRVSPKYGRIENSYGIVLFNAIQIFHENSIFFVFNYIFYCEFGLSVVDFTKNY